MSQNTNLPQLQGDIALAIFNAMRGKCTCKICTPTKALIKITDTKEKIKAIKSIVEIALKEPSDCGLGQFFKVNLPVMEKWILDNKTALK